MSFVGKVFKNSWEVLLGRFRYILSLWWMHFLYNSKTTFDVESEPNNSYQEEYG